MPSTDCLTLDNTAFLTHFLYICWSIKTILLGKVKKVFACSNCGVTSPKWEGKCHSCGEWNTFVEEVIHKPAAGSERESWRGDQGARVVRLQDVKEADNVRIMLPDAEFNRVLGGGIVSGSITLIGGQPGIGKSTLLLQVALQLGRPVLYVSGEESEEQIKMRAGRIGTGSPPCFLLTETRVPSILKQARKLSPDLLVVDSIQTLSAPYLDSPPGSVSQVRECAAELQRFAKETGIPVVLIGHINKEGAIAGPKLLEHIVDCVLQFEGDRHYSYRILRTIKNRFGSTDEMGIYEMHASGLREVSNPSELLLSQHEEDLSGSAVAVTMEGMRPMLIETQALVTKAVYGNPQRSATGFDLRRLNMLLAVLEKRGGFPFGSQDVFLNLAGGLKVSDPAMDLGVVAALISSLEDVSLPPDHCFSGEVGLSGEVRAVSKIEQRIQEAARLGFKRIFISRYNTKGLAVKKFGIEIVETGRVSELCDQLFPR